MKSNSQTLRHMKKFMITAASAALMLSMVASCHKPVPTDKKEIMDQFVAGTLNPSYVPAAFFVHFSPDAKEGQAAVDAHLEYFAAANADILKVQFEQRVPRIRDYELQESWDAVESLPEDFYRPTLEIISGLQEKAGDAVYVIPTIYSAYQLATQSLGEKGIREGAVNHPEDLKRVLGYYSDALKWLVSECKKIGIEGFYMTTQGGEMKYYDIPGFFDTFIKPFDLDVMNACSEGTRMNILHICDWEGTYDDLTRYADYPGQIVNTPINLNGTPFTMKDGEKLFKRPVLGGLERQGAINTATPDEVAGLVRQAIGNGPEGRLMIGAECTVSSAPLENICAAVSAAHSYGKTK